MSTQQPQTRYEQFPCNYFQIVSIQLNIRYNGGVALPPLATVNQVAMLFYQSMSRLGANVQVGLVPTQTPSPAPAGQQTGKPVILRQIIDRTPGATGQKLNFAPPVVAPALGRTLDELVTDNLYLDQPLPAVGPVRLFLYTKEEDKNPPTANSIVTAAIFNCNAALWDCVTLKTVLTAFCASFATQIEGKKVAVPPQPVVQPKLGGWAKILHDHSQKKKQDAKEGRQPKFLPTGEEGEVATKIAEILPATSAASLTERRVRITLDAETVKSCHDKMPQKSEKSATYTTVLVDFGVACFAYALAEVYFRNNPDKSKLTVGFAIQLDPRVVFKELLQNEDAYVHALSVLSMGRTVNRSEISDNDGIAAWLLNETKRVGDDISARMERGEGLTKALELATGQLDREHMAQAAVELVDHGTYDTHSHGVELGHRFDMCELMSTVVHVEDSGELKLEAQLGKDQDRETTLVMLARIAEMWKQVSSS